MFSENAASRPIIEWDKAIGAVRSSRVSQSYFSTAVVILLTLLVHAAAFFIVTLRVDGSRSATHGSETNYAEIILTNRVSQEEAKSLTAIYPKIIAPPESDWVQVQNNIPRISFSEQVNSAKDRGFSSSSVSSEILKWQATVREAIHKVLIMSDAVNLGEECKLVLIQDTGGRVLGARMEFCNADNQVRESVLSAIYHASPLPPYPGSRGLSPAELSFQ